MKSLVWQIFPLPNVGLLAPGKVICHYEKDSWRQRSKKKNETVDNFPKDRLEVVLALVFFIPMANTISKNQRDRKDILCELLLNPTKSRGTNVGL